MIAYLYPPSLNPCRRSCDAHRKILERDVNKYRTLWMPLWRREAEVVIFREAMRESVAEYEVDVHRAMQVRDMETPEASYTDLVRDLGALEDQSRGTGSKSAILAAVLAWLYAERPFEGLRLAANLLQSDTDTIASMAGALLGVVAPSPPPGTLCDRDYIGYEAKRLHDISTGARVTKSFVYPDFLEWEAPRTQADAVYTRGEDWYLSGLGLLVPQAQVAEHGGHVWQWFNLAASGGYYQSLLLKRRHAPMDLGAKRASADVSHAQGQLAIDSPNARQLELSAETAPKPMARSQSDRPQAQSASLPYVVADEIALHAGFEPARDWSRPPLLIAVGSGERTRVGHRLRYAIVARATESCPSLTVSRRAPQRPCGECAGKAGAFFPSPDYNDPRVVSPLRQGARLRQTIESPFGWHVFSLHLQSPFGVAAVVVEQIEKSSHMSK